MVHTGNVQPSIDQEEHDDTYGVKKVATFGWDGSKMVQLLTNSSGSLVTGNLVPEKFDYISITYTGGNPTTVVYKTGGSGGTTVATLTLVWGDYGPTSITKA